jgi:hypothetical protein
MVKMTLTLDITTIERLKRIAKRLQKPQSFILREAICHYERRADHLGKAERKQRIDLFDQLIAKIPSRPASETDTELQVQRLSRRKSWQRRTPSKG